MHDAQKSDALIDIARRSVEQYVRTGTEASLPESIPTELQGRAGAFVCIKKRGQLRGCIGTIEATQPNLAAEVARNAISAALSDPRFEPVTADELDALVYTVDILTPPEPVSDPTALDPKQYGVIVESGRRRGLLLPDLEGVDTVEDQIGIALRKAGIREDEPYSLYRFEVQRHGDQ